MYFLILFEPTGERVICQNEKTSKTLTVKDLLEWITDRFHFETGSGEIGNRRLSLLYENTELQSHWFLEDINIRFGSTVKCVIIEDRIPDYRLYLPIRNETFDIFDSNLHPIETTILQLRIVASNRSGLPLSAFRLVNDKRNELFDHVRLSQYDIDYRATFTIQTWVGWSDFFTYAIKGYTKAVLKLLSSDELVRQYMLQVALHIAAHYGNVDLARALLQLGARADRPVGHHPSRQWCSSDYLHPEYFRCPIHEAIMCQQVGIVLLCGSRDVGIFQKADGYGIKPWRLALRQESSPKQREIGLFILSKQFGGTQLPNKITLPHRHVYVFKQWAERARERVYAKYGLQYSSLKRKPFINNGESLLGYKILVDGHNNDFQDYYSTAEYAKEKTRQVCITLDEREKNKLKNMENYMKNVVGSTSTQTKFTSINSTATQQIKGATSLDVTPNPEEISTGKKLWTKVANLYRFESFLLRNAIDLIESGLLTDESLLPKNRPNVPGAINRTVSRVSSSLSSLSPVNPNVPFRIRLFVERFRLLREMMYKPDKDGRTLRHLSGAEWARVRRGLNNDWQTLRASTALSAKKKQKGAKMKAKKRSVKIQLPDIHQQGESSAKIPLPRERQKVDYRFILRGNDKHYHEIMYDWERTAGLTLPSLAVQSLSEATKFQRKSWMRQVDIAIQFATNRSQRVFQAVP
ncbi:unnamed protein product [Rotaria sp. Silwood2]|nr:unnamed protein product [Rotaria sp. Silwood2]CAF3315776.1 unnamed protein product [Rotaria sp. Silwood2]CAF4108564.1 unnamed protein product [Rotaria sp. Silwood2]CAF4113181.1 unnamed protein product [Rotaria sp. Silwood2]